MSNILSKAELDSQVLEKRARISDLKEEIRVMQEDFYLREAGLAIGIKCLVGSVNGLKTGYVREAELTGHSKKGWLYFDNCIHCYFYSGSAWRECEFPYHQVIQAVFNFLEKERASL